MITQPKKEKAKGKKQHIRSLSGSQETPSVTGRSFPFAPGAAAQGCHGMPWGAMGIPGQHFSKLLPPGKHAKSIKKHQKAMEQCNITIPNS